MKKLILLSASLLLISGCQHFSALTVNQDQRTFSAPSYLGKELPSAFLDNQHNQHEDNGHNLRGFDFGKRHWGF